MQIEEGKYYTNISGNETYIMLVIPRRQTLPEGMHSTETLAVHADMSMWTNDWLDEYFKREATEEEVQLFETTKQQRIGLASLPSYGQAVVAGLTDIQVSNG